MQFVARDNLGQGLEITDNKVTVKVDNSGAVQFSTSEAGLKGEVNLPTQNVAVKKITLEGNSLKLTKTDDSEETIALPVVPVDVKLKGAELTENNTKLKLTLSDNTVLEVGLSDLIPPAKTAEQLFNDLKDLEAFKQFIKTTVKEGGTEVQDLAGTSQGYLVQ